MRVETSPQIQLCTIKNAKLFSAVMQLRYQSYSADNRLTWQRSWLDMYDQWDERSVLAVAMLAGNPIGSLRVTVNTHRDEPSHPLPYGAEETSIAPTDYVEASRLCIAPEYRGKGLWYPLAAQMVRLGEKSGRRFIVGSAREELLATWLKVGFCKTGHRYINVNVGNQIDEMMILDIKKVINDCDNLHFRQILLASIDTIVDEESLVILSKPFN